MKMRRQKWEKRRARDLLRNLFPCLPDEERLRLKEGEVHLLEGHEAGDLPELVEEPGAEPHVLRRKVPSSAGRVDIDDAISITMRRDGVITVGQCRGGRGGEETATDVAVAAREGGSKAGGAEGQERAEKEEVAKRRRARRHPLDSTDWLEGKLISAARRAATRNFDI